MGLRPSFSRCISCEGHCFTDKKLNKIFLICKGNSDGSGCKVIYEEGLPNIWGKAQIFSHIWGGRWSYMNLQALPSGFPYIWVNFCFLFISVEAMVLLIKTIESSTVYCDMNTGLWGWTWGPSDSRNLSFFQARRTKKRIRLCTS